MSEKERAKILVTATAWRIDWEKDNPQFSGIFLEPKSFTGEVYKRLWSDLLDLIVLLINQQKVLQERLTEIGSFETLPQYDINALRVWTQTIGVPCGMARLDNVITLWNYLHDAVPFINEALTELKAAYEFNRVVSPEIEFLWSLPVQQIAQETNREPNLSA